MARSSTSWKKGQAGNPNGRPRGETLNGQLWEILNKQIKTGRNKGKTYWTAIFEQLAKKAAAGSPWAIQFVYERFAGKATQPVSGANGGPLEIVFSAHFDGV